VCASVREVTRGRSAAVAGADLGPVPGIERGCLDGAAFRSGVRDDDRDPGQDQGEYDGDRPHPPAGEHDREDEAYDTDAHGHEVAALALALFLAGALARGRDEDGLIASRHPLSMRHRLAFRTTARR